MLSSREEGYTTQGKTNITLLKRRMENTYFFPKQLKRNSSDITTVASYKTTSLLSFNFVLLQFAYRKLPKCTKT